MPHKKHCHHSDERAFKRPFCCFCPMPGPAGPTGPPGPPGATGSLNIYNSNGSLSSERFLALNGFDLNIIGGGGTGATAGFTGPQVIIDGKLTVVGAVIPTNITVAGPTNNTFLDMTDGQFAAVSNPNQGRIIFNAASETFE